MKPKSTLRAFLLGYAILATSTAFAADGTWLQTAAGPFNWGDSPNWSGGTIADGADSTAYFTANITAAQTVTLDTARTIGNISFHDAVTSSHNLTISGTEILTLDRTVGIPVIDVTQTGRTLTINSPVSGSDGLRKDGIGILTLGGSSNYTGGTTITGGTLNMANTGSIGGALTIGATGTFNSIRIASGSLTLDALTASKGDGTVTSTAAGASNAATLTFGSLAARAAGATANFTLATNTSSTSGTPNKIVFTDTTNAPLDSGSNNAGNFFGGTNYARYDVGGYMRATVYGTDSNANATLSGTAVTTLGTIDATKDVQFTGAAAATSTADGAQSAVTSLNVADGTAFKVGQAISGTGITANTFITAITGNSLTLNQATGSVANGAVITPYNLVSAQTTGDVNTLNLSGNGASLWLDAAQTLGVNGILRSGGTTNIVSVISGGTGIQSASSGGEMVVRTNAAADILQIATPILANGASSLTKSGAGTLIITGAHSYTGVTTINDGTLTNRASSTSTSGWVLNGGTLSNANAVTNMGTGPITVNGNAFFTPVRTDGGNVLANYTFANNLTVNSGASISLTNGNQFTSMVLNGVLDGTGTVIMNTGAGGAAGYLTLGNTGNTFTGTIQINSIGNGNGLVTVNSLLDSPNNIRFSTLGGANAGIISLGSGATSPLSFTQRKIELYGTQGAIIDNSNTASSSANTFTISTNLLVSAAGAKTLTFQGANTGNNAFNGVIANGSVAAANDAVISVTKAGAGKWTLGNAGNTFTGAITLNTTSSSAGTLAYASAAGTNAITFNQTTSTATLSYVGAAPITMSGLISASALTSGTITLDASGLTSADTVNYSNTSSLTSVATSNTVRKLALSGTNTGNNIFAGAFTNNTGTTNAATLTKSGAGTWVLTGANAYTGVTTVSGGKLALGANNVLPDTSNVSIGAAILDADTFTDTAGTLDVTAASTINLGSGAALAFADSNAVDWTGGTLNITGTLGATSLRFGTTSSGLTPGQLAVISVNGSGLGTYTLNVNGYLVSGGGGAPEIAVEQPAATDIANGGSQGFGTVTLGSNTSLVFTIRNTGTADLNLTGSPLVAVSGTNAGDFTVTATPTTPVTSGGGTTTFTVQFAPGAAGARSAVLTIANDDSDEGTFTINVNGTGQTQYDAWSGGAAFEADTNGDGVKNGLAFLLGATGPNATVTLPTVTQSGGNLKLNFDMLKPANRGTATLSVQHSRDLGIADPWTTVPVTDVGSGPTNGVTFVVTPGGGTTNGIEATIGSAEAGGTGKLFGRLQANP